MIVKYSTISTILLFGVSLLLPISKAFLIGRPSYHTTSVRRRRNIFNTDIDLSLRKYDTNKHYATKSHGGEVKNNPELKDDQEVDVAIIGAGLGGLCAGAILNTLYSKKVAIFESHYLPGGCAHAFERKASNGQTFTFDSGPTILLGCSQEPFSALRQVMEVINQKVDWIRYDGWGMIENPLNKDKEIRWKCELGENKFQSGPLKKFGGKDVLEEFEELREVTSDLLAGASIPAMAMRPGPSALIPLLRYFPTLVELISLGDATTGTFEPYMDGPKFVVKDQWLRNWLDALAFSLSGLPAARTSAAAMAFVLDDMHRKNAALDYPRGGMGEVVNALIRGLEEGGNNNNDSKLYLRQTVKSIDFNHDASRAIGITLNSKNKKSGENIKVRVKDGVICNAPVWSLQKFIQHDAKAMAKFNQVDDDATTTYQGDDNNPNQMVKESWESSSSSSSTNMNSNQEYDQQHQGRSFIKQMTTKKTNKVNSQQQDTKDDDSSFLFKCNTAEMTGSFLHLHVAIDATGLDLSKMEAHYTVMDRGLDGDGTINDGPCGELNMIAVSNPCVIDPTLAPKGYMVLHAYGAGNEPYHIWEDKTNGEYLRLKQERSEVLWRAMESIIPDIRDRIVLDMTGSPLTHERFLRRPRGTYGAATEDYLKDGSTPISNLVLAGDSIFPGIGIPAVAISGASAANSFINPFQHLMNSIFAQSASKEDGQEEEETVVQEEGKTEEDVVVTAEKEKRKKAAISALEKEYQKEVDLVK